MTRTGRHWRDWRTGRAPRVVERAPLPSEAGALAVLLPADVRERAGWGLYMPAPPPSAVELLDAPDLASPDRIALALALSLWDGRGVDGVDLGDLVRLPPPVLARVGRALSALAAGVPLSEWAGRELAAGVTHGR